VPLPGATIGGMRNAGARQTEAMYLSFLDSDCSVESNYFEEAIAVLRATGAGATGCKVDLPEDPGWLRDPQRFPVRILVLPDEAKEAGIDLGRSGAQANVLIFTSDKSLLNPIGKLWIKIVALLSYLQ